MYYKTILIVILFFIVSSLALTNFNFASAIYSDVDEMTPDSEIDPSLYQLENALQIATSTNPIVIENQKTGTKDWVITRTGTDIDGQIKGYADKASVNLGRSIDFKVSVNPSQNFSMEIYRMGYYQGLGGRLMMPKINLHGTRQPACPTVRTTGLLECKWTTSYTLTIPQDWVSGIYLVKLVNQNGFQNYINFVVRDDGRKADGLYQEAVNTYQAYNDYPDDIGKSLYPGNSHGTPTIKGTPEAVKVSFDRPYATKWGGKGSGQFLNWEVYGVRWLEKNGYDITYATDVDTHINGDKLLNYKAFLSFGHDEYWTKNMYDAAQKARAKGINLAFFGANDVYWQARYEPSSTGGTNRIMVVHKGGTDPDLGPLTTDPIIGETTTVKWRDRLLKRPEQTLMGVMWSDVGTKANDPFTVINEQNWVFDNTGLKNGDKIPEMVGYEYDRLHPDCEHIDAGECWKTNFPGPIFNTRTIVGQTHLLNGLGKPDIANSSIYQAPSGAWIFAAGSIYWSLGLEGSKKNRGIQKITSNVLKKFGLIPAYPDPTPSPTPSPTSTPIPTQTPTPTPTP